MNLSSDAIAKIEGYLTGNRDFFKKQMAKKAPSASPPDYAVDPYMLFLQQNLQVQHRQTKHGKHHSEKNTEQKADTQIHEIKPDECRITTETIDAINSFYTRKTQKAQQRTIKITPPQSSF